MVRHAAAHKHLRQKPKKTWFDYIFYFFAVATPLFELPQAYGIYHTKSAAGVSFATWGFFALASAMWTIYGIREKALPVLITSALYLGIESTIVFGIIQYS